MYLVRQLRISLKNNNKNKENEKNPNHHNDKIPLTIQDRRSNVVTMSCRKCVSSEE